MAPAELGDLVPLGQALMNFSWFGYVTDIDTPSGVWATMEAVGDEAFVTMDVLQGPRGFPGQNAPLVEILWDPDIETVDDLPTDWTIANKNKGFWIGDLVYIWDGAGTWVPKRPGPAGPAGKTPIIAVSMETLSWADQVLGIDPEVDIAGTPEHPVIHFQVPQGEPGPVGPVGPIEDSVNFVKPGGDKANILQGAVPAWNKVDSKWYPTAGNLWTPRFFTVPEGAFTNFSGIATRQNILAFEIPAMPFDYVIKVGGHLRAVGLEVDADPLIIGAEVRIGNPTSGQLIGRGFGNISTWTTFDAHFSTGSTTMDAVTPDGTIGRIPKNTSGTASTVYVNLYNDGLFGIYNFNKGGAQLDLTLYPVGV